LTTETLVADPQAPSGSRKIRLDQRHYRSISQLPTIWYYNHGTTSGRASCRHLGLAHQCPNHFLGNCESEELLKDRFPCRSQEGDGRGPWQQRERAQPRRGARSTTAVMGDALLLLLL
jgi:hypothetical protein